VKNTADDAKRQSHEIKSKHIFMPPLASNDAKTP
jgi:hypothetical protein